MKFQILSFIFFLSIVICLRAGLKLIVASRNKDQLVANSKDVNTFILSLIVVIIFAFSIYRAAAGLG